MKKIDLTIVADRWCPTSRTYLTYLKAAGFQPAKIILADFLGPHKKLRLVRRLCGHRLAGWAVTKKRPDWPDYAASIRELCEKVQENVEHPVDYFAPFDYGCHAAEVERLAVEDFDDPVLVDAMIRQKCRTFLYTNGGRVPARILNTEGIKVFHIHPGVVPHVRGSDGLLWSLLERGKPGVSCFYMDPGIDTGPVIATREFERPRFNVRPPRNAEGEDNLYRALLLAYDPHLRASLFRDVIRSCDGENLANLPAVAQNDKGSRDNYLWMHPGLRRRVLAEVSCG